MFRLELSNLFISDLDLCLIVHFVGEAHDLNVTARVLFDFGEPDRNAQETLLVGQVKHHDDAIGTFVVGVCDCAVPLLTRSVPDLKLDRRLVDLKGAEAEIDSNRAQVVFLEAVILNHKDEAKS